jgi:hypothetical protein
MSYGNGPGTDSHQRRKHYGVGDVNQGTRPALGHLDRNGIGPSGEDREGKGSNSGRVRRVEVHTVYCTQASRKLALRCHLFSCCAGILPERPSFYSHFKHAHARLKFLTTFETISTGFWLFSRSSIPVEYFACIQPPSREVMMDASDTGLCALEPQLRQFIRVQFTEAVRRTFQTMKEENSINVRELMSAALAALYWGPAWTGSGRHRIHVRMKIDNTSAVSWLNKRSSGEPVARIYNRLISLSEFRHSFTCSAEHIPGELNTMADAGSRAWTTDHPLHRVWTN